jgi:hypothetical protein
VKRDVPVRPSNLVLLLGLTALACPGLVPGSRVYKPVSDREAGVFARATRDVYPGDVRQAPERYRKSLVAWAGILRSYEVSKENELTTLRFNIEHRYFDWIEDFGLQPERLFLSPRGEGMFRAAWSMPVEAFASVPEKVHEGDLLIVYGYPAEVRDQVVGFYPTEYVRLIGKNAYTDKKLDYGRRGERAAQQ